MSFAAGLVTALQRGPVRIRVGASCAALAGLFLLAGCFVRNSRAGLRTYLESRMARYESGRGDSARRSWEGIVRRIRTDPFFALCCRDEFYNTKNASRKERLLLALSEALGGAQCSNEVIYLLEQADPALRLAGVRFCVKFSVPLAMPYVASALESSSGADDISGLTRSSALFALRRHWGRTAARYFVHSLNDPSPRVQLSALAALRDLRVGGAAPALLEYLKALSPDGPEAEGLVIAACKALEGATGEKPPEEIPCDRWWKKREWWLKRHITGDQRPAAAMLGPAAAGRDEAASVPFANWP